MTIGGDEKLGLLLLSIPVLAFLIDFFLSHSLLGYAYRLFVAPGVILHEMSHALACVATGAKIHAISLFDKEGGSVEHQKSKIPFFGQLLISIAPFIVGIIAIYLLSRFVGIKEVNLTSVTLSYDSISRNILEIVKGINWQNTRTLIFIYLLFSVAVTMNPSKQDIKNIAFTLALLVAVGYAVYRYTSFRPDFASVMPLQLVIVISTVVLLLILCLILSTIVFVLSKLVKPL